jgi:uncharacterized protein (DUF1810 family)
MSCPDELERFVEAQNVVIDRVLQELRVGQKRTHWMWYVFPQLAGLGYSAMSQRYAIASAHEARLYLTHPVLRPRLIECTELVNQVEGRSVTQIFGTPDDMKFQSSMTLFSRVQAELKIFDSALTKYFRGTADQKTITMLNQT